MMLINGGILYHICIFFKIKPSVDLSTFAVKMLEKVKMIFNFFGHSPKLVD